MATRPLPGWARSNRDSVEREAAPYRGLPPEQRLELLGKACDTAIALLDLHEDRERVLRHRDPLPESSTLALARLRREARDRRSR